MEIPRPAAAATATATATGLAAVLLLVGSAPARAADPEPPPVIEDLRIEGGDAVVVIANRGAAPSAPSDLVVTTRAAGRLVGSSRRRLQSLAPGLVREERVPLGVWGAERPDLRASLERQGCCTTRVWLEPDGAAPLEIRHGIGPAAAAAPHRAEPEGGSP